MNIGIIGWDYEEHESLHLEKTVRQWGQTPVLFTLDDVTCSDLNGRLDVLVRGERALNLDVIVSRAQLRIDHWQSDLERLTLLSNLNGVPIIDPADVFVAAESKLVGLQKLARAGLPVPPTSWCQSVSEVHAQWCLYERIVIKPSFGYGGFDVECVEEFDERRIALIKQLLQRYGGVLVQPFLPHPQGDLRVTVIGDEIGFSFRRVPAQNHWKCNVAQGASVAPYEPTDRVRDVAVAAARTMGITIAGLDIMEWDQDVLIIEINNVPGWFPLTPREQDEAAGKITAYAMDRATKARQTLRTPIK